MKQLIEWRNDFRTGIPEIDQDHEVLIKEINDLWRGAAPAKSVRTVKEFLGKVYDHVAAHFSREEAIMQGFHYGQYAEHKAAHESLLEELHDIRTDYSEGYCDYAPEEMLGQRVSAWFTDHIQAQDTRLGKLVGDQPNQVKQNQRPR